MWLSFIPSRAINSSGSGTSPRPISVVPEAPSPSGRSSPPVSRLSWPSTLPTPPPSEPPAARSCQTCLLRGRRDVQPLFSPAPRPTSSSASRRLPPPRHLYHPLQVPPEAWGGL